MSSEKVEQAAPKQTGREYLIGTQMGDLLEGSGEVYFAYHDDPINKGVDLLLKHKLQSIPVLNKKTKAYSFLDLVDVVFFCTKVRFSSHWTPTPSPPKSSSSLSLLKIYTIIFLDHDFVIRLKKFVVRLSAASS